VRETTDYLIKEVSGLVQMDLMPYVKEIGALGAPARLNRT